jgi:Transposase/Transposase IS116/IS110/IS902 family
VKDSEWLADLLRHGLLKASFIPPKPIRELRELARYRKTLVQERTQEINRLQKVLEGANIKLAAVATDILGTSGRDMLNALISGEQDAQALAELARGRLRAKLPALQKALEGRVQPTHRFLLARMLAHIQFLEDSIVSVQLELEQHLRPFEEALTLLQSIAGIHLLAAITILSEIGIDMSRFPSAKHFASWAGLVRCITRLSIPGVTRKNSKGGSWVTGSPRVERQREQEHATESGRKPEDAYGDVPQDPHNRVRAKLPEVQFPIGVCPHPSLQRLRAMSSHGVNSHADTPPFVMRDDGQRVH